MKVIYIENQKIKGVAEQSSVFASEIFTAISQIPEKPPEVIGQLSAKRRQSKICSACVLNHLTSLLYKVANTSQIASKSLSLYKQH